MSTREEYIEKLKRQLDELNAQIDNLEEKAKAGQEEIHKEYEQQMSHMRELSHAAMLKLNEIRAASEDKWEGLVAEGEKVHKAFVHSVNYFKSQLK